MKIVICENYHGNGTYIISYQKLEKSSENGEDERKNTDSWTSTRNCAALLTNLLYSISITL